ncbi:hypothetical protein BDF22DRAFT_693152 [Syncephalis plumigaleata]|nr:hypothetical protein BDF22DRAFT_693152 [Syncephalis plumigaleata]
MTTPQIRHCANALQVSALLYPNEFGLNTSASSVDRSHECFSVEPICAPLLPPDNASDTQPAPNVSNRAIAETTRIPSAYPLHPAPLSNDMSNGDGIGRRGRRRTNRSRGYHHHHRHYPSANANQHLSAYPHTGTVNYFEQPVSSDQQVFRIIDINPLYQKRLQANSSVFDYMTVNDGGHIHDESSYEEARHHHHHRRRLPRVRSSNEIYYSNPEHHYTDTATLPTLDHLNTSNINLASFGTRLPSPLDMPSLYENRTTRKQKRVKRLFQWISSVIRRKKRQQ